MKTIKQEYKTYGGYFEPENKQKRIQELEEEMNKPTFWDDKKQSEKVINELNNLKNTIDKCSTLKNKIESDI